MFNSEFNLVETGKLRFTIFFRDGTNVCNLMPRMLQIHSIKYYSISVMEYQITPQTYF